MLVSVITKLNLNLATHPIGIVTVLSRKISDIDEPLAQSRIFGKAKVHPHRCCVRWSSFSQMTPCRAEQLANITNV